MRLELGHTKADCDKVTCSCVEEMGLTPNVTMRASEPEASPPEMSDSIGESWDHAEFVRQMMHASRALRHPRGRTGHRLLHRNPPGEGDDLLGLCTRSRSLSDHFHARFGERLTHRFKPAPSRGIRLRKRAMSADIPGGGNSSSGSEQVSSQTPGSSGVRSVVGRGHHPVRRTRVVNRHLGCHRRWFLLATEAEKQLVADAERSFLTRQWLTSGISPQAASIDLMTSDNFSEGQSSSTLNAEVDSAGLPIDEETVCFHKSSKRVVEPLTFEVSKLSLSDAPGEPMGTD